MNKLLIFLLILTGPVGLVLLIWGLRLVHDDQVGILTRKMAGRPLPQGHIIARNQEVGILSEVLKPGLYWRFPFFWKIERVSVTTIGVDEVGVVESIDGEPLPTGRLLAARPRII